ncbi:ANTAR domain-containing protein [Streptomyces sp. SB3404]|uniref:ANTAR domain-containing protein n=1 Tax=Streptomyces boncukensis TaxID=2711219 RepID=A0A6G4X0K8_9ACTN|nr:ANTAR domain-containing protein [Streptomyces boncukensis]
MASPAQTGEAERLRQENAQLHRALDSRAVIDQARGMIMALAPCSSGAAWHVLVDVSQHANVKLRDVAHAMVSAGAGQPMPPELQDHLRRAFLRRRSAR